MLQSNLLEGTVLAAVAQAQPGTLGGIPLWVILVVAVVVIIIGVIWFLYEEKQKSQEQAEPVTDTAPAEKEVEPDDFTVIEGIGPRISGLLQAAGIITLNQLADTEVSRLQELLDEAGLGRLANPSTWPEQAKLAAAGDWEGLQKLQDELHGGRRL